MPGLRCAKARSFYLSEIEVQYRFGAKALAIEPPGEEIRVTVPDAASA
jgi:hypothetical protein